MFHSYIGLHWSEVSSFSLKIWTRNILHFAFLAVASLACLLDHSPSASLGSGQGTPSRNGWYRAYQVPEAIQNPAWKSAAAFSVPSWSGRKWSWTDTNTNSVGLRCSTVRWPPLCDGEGKGKPLCNNSLVRWPRQFQINQWASFSGLDRQRMRRIYGLVYTRYLHERCLEHHPVKCKLPWLLPTAETNEHIQKKVVVYKRNMSSLRWVN